jgi:hypothetical protein
MNTPISGPPNVFPYTREGSIHLLITKGGPNIGVVVGSSDLRLPVPCHNCASEVIVSVNRVFFDKRRLGHYDTPITNVPWMVHIPGCKGAFTPFTPEEHLKAIMTILSIYPYAVQGIKELLQTVRDATTNDPESTNRIHFR